MSCFLLGKRPDSAEIMQTVRKLYENDANVRRHGKHELADIFGLTQFAAPGNPPYLGQSIDDVRHGIAELFPYQVQGKLSVFHGVVQ